MLLGIMAASGMFGKRNLSSVDLDLEFPTEVYANRAFMIKVCLTNARSYLPVFLLRIRVGGESGLFPFVERKTSSSIYVPYLLPRRGYQRIDELYVESRFPFNFFIRSRRIRKSFELHSSLANSPAAC